MSTYITDLRNSDWLSKILNRLNLKPLTAGIFVSIINVILNLSLAFHYGAWYPSSNCRGLSTEPQAWITDFLAQPMVIAYFCWIQGAGNNLLSALISEGIFEYNEFVRNVLAKNQSRLQNPWLSRFAILISLSLGILFGLTFTQVIEISSRGWILAHPTIAWVRAFVGFIMVYTSIMLLFDVTIIILTLSEIFKNQTIRVEPFHPDNAGGLGVLGRFSANLGYLIGVFGVWLGVAWLVNVGAQHDIVSVDVWFIQQVIGLILYVFLAPIFFYLPIHSAHIAMAAYRDVLLREISEELNIVYSEMRTARSQNADKIDPLLKRIRQLEETYKLTRRFTTWPFNYQSLRKFVGLVTAPVLPVLISVVSDLLVGVIK